MNLPNLPPETPNPHISTFRKFKASATVYKLLIGITLLAFIAGGAWFAFKPAGNSVAPSSPDGGKAPAVGGGSKGGGRVGGFDPNRVQPVVAVPARVADIHVVQTALGTVTALKVVTVKARTDGLLQEVFFREGQAVKAGDVLAQIDPQPLRVALAQAEGQLARDMAQLNNARLDLERYRTLLTQDSIAKQQLDAQESLVRQYEGTVKIDRALVDNAKLQLSYTRVTAPISGRLGLRQVDAGNVIRSSDAAGLVVITQVDPVTVVFSIPQDHLPRVLRQLKAGEKPAVEAWDREQKNKLASGFLISTDNQIDTATGTIKLKAQFANPDGLLFPNQFVNVKMVVESKKDATVIPLAAIQRGAHGTLVYVVKEDQTITTRPVKMGPSENDNVMIESGLAPGEIVVTDGIDRLREGGKVEVIAPFVPKARGAGKAERRGEEKTTAPTNPATKATTPRMGDAPRSGNWGNSGNGGNGSNMTEEQKAALRKRMEGMTEEQKAEFRKQMQEQRSQQQ